MINLLKSLFIRIKMSIFALTIFPITILGMLVISPLLLLCWLWTLPMEELKIENLTLKMFYYWIS